MCGLVKEVFNNFCLLCSIPTAFGGLELESTWEALNSSCSFYLRSNVTFFHEGLNFILPNARGVAYLFKWNAHASANKSSGIRPRKIMSL